MTEQKFTEKTKKDDYFSIVRILQTDIPGNKKMLVGLTYIKGISWSVSNAICKILKLDVDKKIDDLDKKEIEIIKEFIKNPKLPTFLLNRRKDFTTGEDNHLLTTKLDIMFPYMNEYRPSPSDNVKLHQFLTPRWHLPLNKLKAIF